MTSSLLTDSAAKRNAAKAISVLVLRSVSGVGGGAESIILRTAQQIDPSRVRYVVACIRRTGDSQYNFDVRLAPTGVEYHEIAQRRIIDRRVWQQLTTVYHQVRPDVVHAHDYKASYYARRLAKRFGVKAMATLHGWSGNSFRERFFYYPMDRLIVRRFPAVIGVSTTIRNTIIRAGADPGRVFTVVNGIDTKAYSRDNVKRRAIRDSLGLNDQHFVIGGIGRLEPEKRFDIFIDTAARLIKVYPQLRFVIAGAGSLYKTLQADIQRRGLGDYCHLLGHRDDIQQIYFALDLLLQSSELEGTPTVVVEAMASEVPVVATDAGGTRDLIEDRVHGLIVPVNQPQCLVAAVEQVMCDPDSSAKRVAAAKHRVERELSFENRTKKLVSVYEMLVQPMRGNHV